MASTNAVVSSLCQISNAANSHTMTGKVCPCMGALCPSSAQQELHNPVCSVVRAKALQTDPPELKDALTAGVSLLLFLIRTVG